MDKPTASQRAALRHRESSGFAPSYNLPHFAMISIEHPFVIKNVDRAIETLGGLQKIKALVHENNQRAPAQLYMHPGDPVSKPLSASSIKTNNVVLQVTVPKRTGLKRRRRVLNPYHEGMDQSSSSSSSSMPMQSHDALKSVDYLLRSLRDNVERYKIEPIGSVHITHRFRNMPDFVYSTTNSPFITKMRENILPFEYEKLKNFTFDMSKGPRPNIDLVPPPRWSHINIPFNYSYLQNSSASQLIDEYGAIIKNIQRPMRVRNQAIPHDEPDIPAALLEDLTPLTLLEPAMRRLIESARLLFDERPIWTRRALHNRVAAKELSAVGINSAKYMYQYVGYLFDSGPWRDAVVKFGVDPRKDPSLRIYQTMTFMLDKEDFDRKKTTKKPPRFGLSDLDPRYTHIFDGKSVSIDGKVWQVCDITDPLLSSLLSTTDIREDCHHSDGWYHSGTWAKAKAIMRHKISSLLAGELPTDTDYIRVVHELPELIDSHNAHLVRFSKNAATPVEAKLAFQVRSAAKNYQYVESHGGSKLGIKFSRYGYRRNNDKTDEVDKETELEEEEEDEEYIDEERIWEEEQQQQQKTIEREDAELRLEDADSSEDEDMLSGRE